jgi:hypothetical protein
MKFTKNMKAGYQGKHDSMRAMAERLLDHPGHAKDVYYSKSAADKEKMRPFKTGGEVMDKKNGSMKKTKDCNKLQKFAVGGAGKVRHGEATPDGKLKSQKKGSTKGCVYY